MHHIMTVSQIAGIIVSKPIFLRLWSIQKTSYTLQFCVQSSKMTQAQIDLHKQLIPKLANLSQATQTESGNEKVFLLESNKIIKLYYSNVYKEIVLAFCISNSKSFLINKKTWKKFRKIIPVIEEAFDT